MNLLSNNFDILYNSLCEKVSAKKFKLEKSDTMALFIGEAFTYKMQVDTQNGRIYLQRKETIPSDDLQEENWVQLSEWIFNEETDRKNVNLICDDFAETLNGPAKTVVKKGRSKKNLSDESADGLFFANRMVNVFPELRDEIFVEKQCYSEFRSAQFVKEHILPKILELLAQGKDIKKIERLIKLLNDLYKSSSLNIKCLITIGILNNITDTQQIQLVQKYMDNKFISAYLASSKLKGKKIKPDKLSFTARLMRNASYK